MWRLECEAGPERSRWEGGKLQGPVDLDCWERPLDHLLGRDLVSISCTPLDKLFRYEVCLSGRNGVAVSFSVLNGVSFSCYLVI